MYQGKDFQENDRPSFYSGRRIRRAVVEEPQSHQEREIPEETHGHEEMQNHEEPRHRDTPPRGQIQETREQPQPLRRAPRANNQVTDDPKAKLVRSLERNLTDDTQKHLIGVFGMNSDNTITEALRELNNSMYGNFFVLQRTRLLIDDVFTMFASAMLDFMENSSYRIRGLDDRWVQNQVFMYLQEIHSSNYEPDYEYGLTRLARLGQKLERGEKCRDLMSFIKQQMYPRYPKFVWNIEVDMGELNYNLLNNLSQIANENLIVIVNTLGPLDFEAGLIGSQMGYGGCPNQTGHQILSKYIWFEDIIQAD